MKRLRNLFGATLALAALALVGCEDWFGDKTDLGFIEVPNYDSTTVLFVPVQPFFTGYTRPVDVCFGYDNTIYIVEEGQRIVQVDESGRRIGTFELPGVKRVVQDRRLNLLAIATFDTLVGGIPYTLDALFRLDIVNDNSLNVSNSTIVKRVLHPLYFRQSIVAADTLVRLNDIDVLANDDYYLTRSGPSTGGIFGPDDAVLLFSRADVFQSFISISTSQGVINDYFDIPFGITTFSKPPQGPFVSSSRNFIVGQIGLQPAIKVQYINSSVSSEGDQLYELNTSLVLNDTTKGDGFLYTDNRFSRPVAIEYTGDGTNYIIVADAGKDSLYLFTNNGVEGVPPLPGSASTRNTRVSFGGTGVGPSQFQYPSGLTHQNKILYVADRDNGRICRYRLTSDLN
jgi:hypothetical protein